MVKYIVLDFGMVLAYPTTGNWHITPKFIELVDINKLNREQLKKAFDNFILYFVLIEHFI